MKYKYHFKEGIKKYRTKTYLLVTSLALVFAGSVAALPIMGGASALSMGHKWHLTAPSTVNFYCLGNNSLDVHTLGTVNTAKKGNFTGTGYYNLDTGYTWNASGNVTGKSVTFKVTYTGKQAGAVYNLSGVIAKDGSVSGTADGNCQTFTMPAGSASKHHMKHHDKDQDQDEEDDDDNAKPVI